jgi:hypothetical protein
MVPSWLLVQLSAIAEKIVIRVLLDLSSQRTDFSRSFFDNWITIVQLDKNGTQLRLIDQFIPKKAGYWRKREGRPMVMWKKGSGWGSRS